MTEYKGPDIPPGSVIQSDLLGLFPDKIASLKSTEKPQEPTEVGDYVDITYRAENLLKAIEYYCKASKLKGLDYIYNENPSEFDARSDKADIARIVGSEIKNEDEAIGNIYFKRAIGAAALLATSYNSEEEYSDSKKKINKQMDKFKDKYIGSKNESEREKYRRVLRRQIKQQDKIKAKKINP